MLLNHFCRMFSFLFVFFIAYLNPTQFNRNNISFRRISAGLPAQSIDRLQSIINASARLACGLHKYDHITPELRDRLHWLPIQQRITYQLCLLTFKGIQDEAPPYIVELCQRVNTIESRWRTAYRPADYHRFRKKGVRLRRSVSVEQPAY